MKLTKDQVKDLRRAQVGSHASWYPGPVVIDHEPGAYAESKYITFHSMILKDHDEEYYRVYYEYTKEDDSELVEDSIEIRRVVPHVVNTIEYREI